MRKITLKTFLMGMGIPLIGFALLNLFVHKSPETIILGFITLLISFLALYFVSDLIHSKLHLAYNHIYLIWILFVLGITFYLYFSIDSIEKVNVISDLLGLNILLTMNGFLFVQGKEIK